VAIFDATNTTLERRQYLIDKFHNKVQYMFIESICNDEETLRKNVELKLKYSPDYANTTSEEVCFAAACSCIAPTCTACVADGVVY
jgi:6-phosphofructo-2-kinase